MQDQSQEFEQLRRLLALKRHEAPPPRYFEDFSSRVIDRIEVENTRAGAGWFSNLMELLRVRPAMSASFCLATALVLLAATTLFESAPSSSTAKMPTVEPSFAAASEPVAPASASGMVFVTNLEPRSFGLDLAPKAAVLQPSTNSLFDSPFSSNLRVEPVTFSR